MYGNRQFLAVNPPVTVMLFAVLLGISLLTSDPAYISVTLVSVAIGFFLFDAKASLLASMRICLPIAALLVFVNVIVSQSGTTVLYASAPLPAIGRVLVTKESLGFSATMALKLVLIVSVFSLYGVLLSPDQTYRVFSRFAPRSTLIVVISSLFVPRMKRRLAEVTAIMQLRGAPLKQGRLYQRVCSLFPLLKVLLVSALEDAWSLAEALHSKAYGSGERTRYRNGSWSVRDTAVTILAILLVGLFAFSVFAGKARVRFFPVFQFNWSRVDVAVCSSIALLIIVSFLLIRFAGLREGA